MSYSFCSSWSSGSFSVGVVGVVGDLSFVSHVDEFASEIAIVYLFGCNNELGLAYNRIFEVLS